ncbi:MAG TPA: SGNH/GDSL hydrolase family protein [Acidimicrobiia bacterium]|jgi:hypothetical protein|nr:SGNH/GDSL hydrolase family protein [Acidimicrobiia bacterium]
MTAPPAAEARRRPLKRRVLKHVRKLVGERGVVESSSRNVRNAVKFRMGKPIQRTDLFAWRPGPGNRFGVYAFGGCDLGSVIGAGTALGRRHGGAICIGAFANAPATRSDIILQTLDPPATDLTSAVIERLQLPDGYFEPRLFTPDFNVPGQLGVGRFPKSIIAMSVSSDISRIAYRHREHGFLVDPGGWWLSSSLDEVLSDLSMAKWFASEFKKVGRLTVEESMDNLERIVTEVRNRHGAFVVMLNVLTVDPGRVAFDYSKSSAPNRARRRSYNLALTDLARKLDFPILDVDRITKQHGISGQADFVHYTPQQKKWISREFAELVIESGALEGRPTPQIAAVR